MTKQSGLVAFFGTWQRMQRSTEQASHVQTLYDSWRGPKIAVAGPGTRYGFIGKCLGGAFGLGWRFRLATARKRMRQHPNTEWTIVGHSRGGLIALRLAERLHKDNARVRNLILLDPVASFGFNAIRKLWVPNPDWRDRNIEYRQNVPGNVDNTWALYAYNEDRPHFRPTYVFKEGETEGQNCFRCWFEGDHSDIGGYGSQKAGNFTGGWLWLMCGERFGDAIDWPNAWRAAKKEDYSPEKGLFSRRLMPPNEQLVILAPGSTIRAQRRFLEAGPQSQSGLKGSHRFAQRELALINQALNPTQISIIE
jgi:pimeloyl-ACP methyl ester carboxylesterase